MEIEVKGHSGCSIDIVRQDKKLIIEKGTREPKYVERLYQQALKQQKASETKFQFIRIPEILNITKSDKEMVIQMEYVYSKNFVDYFENAGFEQVNYFVKAIDIFLQSEIDRSQATEVPASVVLEKWDDVKLKTTTNAFTKNREDVLRVLKRSEVAFQATLNPLNSSNPSSLPTILIPVGICHGDLTLSNILFNGNSYFLIDFLDSFIESPLLDMVKIRQDTAHRWSPLMYEGEYDKTRFNIIASKIDEELHKLFLRYDWYVKYYDLFQLMNLLRVLQYGHEEKVVVYLCEEIGKILDKMESTTLNSCESNLEQAKPLNSSKSIEQVQSIIIPIAADKPEYDEIIPHVFRLNNHGIMLCVAGIMGLELDAFDKIYFTILKKHSEHFRLREMMEVQLQRLGFEHKAVVVELDEPTASQPDTIFTTIQKMNIRGSILVKDADCYFEGKLSPENSVFTFPLDSMSQVNPQGKSYVQTDDMWYVTNIIERRIISRDFCTGGYYFEDVNDFLNYYNSNKQYSPLYMSHIIYSALLDGLSFRPVKVKTYKDWGTRQDWTRNE
ncbi:phosphotransferase [Bacteroides sp.]